MKMHEDFWGSPCIESMYTLDGVSTTWSVDSSATKTRRLDKVGVLWLTTTMPQGKAVPEAIQWIIIRLSVKMTSHEIAMYTDIGERKIRDILTHFKNTGTVNVPKRERPTLRRSLGDEERQVISAWYLLLAQSDMTTLLASIQDSQQHTRFVPRWAATGTGGNSWCHSIAVDNLAST